MADVKVTFVGPPSSGSRRIAWFLDSYGPETALSKRFSHLYLYDRSGYLIRRKSLLSDERLDVSDYGAMAYSVDLTPRTGQFAESHLSWVNRDGGQLMLDDVLPQGLGRNATLWVEAPTEWKVLHSEMETQPGVVTVSDIERSVVYLGAQFREFDVRPGTGGVKLAITGEWQFSDAEAAEMVKAVYAEYEQKIGKLQNSVSRVRLQKFRSVESFGIWEADTRGRSVTLTSSDMPFKNQSLQRLHEQLRHELFHLWIPNSVNLSGNFDWFYEGFALYQSLKTGVATNQIRFADYLDTLSRAYAIDAAQTNRGSLVEASKRRWSGSSTTIYARGMLVAFLCDLAMLESSKGKRSITDLTRKLYERHRPPAAFMDGNDAVLKLMHEYGELKTIVDRYITAGTPIDWTPYLQAAGIVAETSGRVVTLSVTTKPNGRQKDLLNKLGYNNWRRLSK